MSSVSALASAGIRSRPIQPQIGSSESRAMRPTRLWSAGASIRNGSNGMKNKRAASPMRGTRCASVRMVRRSSSSTSSLPAMSSPRNWARSSSAISIARASGLRLRRYSRSRSTDCPSLVIAPASGGHTVNASTSGALKKGLRKTPRFQRDKPSNRRQPSVDRGPGAVGIAAGGAAGALRGAIDIDRVGILPAGGAIGLVGRAGHDIAVTAGIRITPGDRGARRAGFQRLHLGGVGAPPVLVVHRRADPVAEQAPDRGADHGSGEPVADAAADGIADQAAGYGADRRAAGFLRPGVGGAGRDAQAEERKCNDVARRHDPQSPFGTAPPP